VLPEQEYPRWEVHKFGGASLADAKLYKTCGNLLIEAARANGYAPSIPTLAVVSASYGTTDELINVIRTAERGDLNGANNLLGKVIEKVLGIARDLKVSEDKLKLFQDNLEKDRVDLSAVLCAVKVMKSVPDTAMELMTGMGEVWSAQTMCAYLQMQGFPAEWMDTRKTLYVADGGSHGLGDKGASNMFVKPLMHKTAEAMRMWWLDLSVAKGWVTLQPSSPEESQVQFVGDPKQIEPMVIVTGFIASTTKGVPTTLKRSGSDYTATIVANLCNASRITMWKNVDGIYTADPRKVPDAFPIKTLLYEEAMELAYFGASVLHPSAMAPCIEAEIPVHVRNVFNPLHPGTVIQGSVHDGKSSQDEETIVDNKNLRRSQMLGQGSFGSRMPRKSLSAGEEMMLDEIDKDKLPVKGVTCVENVSLVNLEDAALIGVPGVLSRMFGALAAKDISVLMITQASSEHSTCCAVADCDAHAARDAVKEAFALELHNHQISRVQIIKNLSALAVVGEGMAYTIGVPAKMFSALASAGIPVRAIAQGSSKRNITAVVDRQSLSKAMQAIHSAFTLSAVPISVGLIGMGRVGEQLIDQLRAEHPRVLKDLNLDLRLRLVVDVGRTLIKQERIDMGNFEAEWEAAAKEPDVPLEGLADKFLTTHYPHSVIVDCTASERVAAFHKHWLRRGIHVISANRKAGATSIKDFLETEEEASAKNVHWSYAVTAGGALPSMVCIQDLLNTGDHVMRVEGMLSSTMDHILSVVSPFSDATPPKKFSEAVVEAVHSGCTEAIALDDILGLDMARKLTILARSVGSPQIAEDIKVSNLLPSAAKAVVAKLNEDFTCGNHCGKDCAKCEAVAAALAPFDADIAARAAKARDKGKCLRCVGVVNVPENTVKIEIKEVSIKDNPMACLCNGNTVVINIHSDRYQDKPLVISGPGTGAKLIAGAVFADLLRIGQSFH